MIIEIAHVVFVKQKDGNFRCQKARWPLGVIIGGLYTLEFVESYAARAKNVVIIEEGRVNA